VNDGPGDPLAQKVDVSAPLAVTDDVTAYPLVAPFDSTITAMSCVVSQRAELMDVLFSVADLSTLRVVGNIAETQLAVLPQLKKGQVRFSAAAYPGRTFEAKTLYVSPTVDPNTRRVSLVAELANREGLFKLGMFVEIRFDSTATERVLTVPAAAVVEIEGRKGVFTAASAPRTFVFKPVITGRETSGKVVIAQGLEAGQKVVTNGAFTLKSELLLQSQTEEE
jgi:RND family efflux transporter MFP subunit